MKIGKSQVDASVKVYGNGPVVIGDRSRIDAGVVICAGEKGVYVGDNVHIARGVILAGTNGQIVFEDFSCMGADGKVYTASEDPSVGLTNPTVPDPYRQAKAGDVRFGRHALVYANVIICPGVTLGAGSGVGAFSIVKADVPAGVLVGGIPANRIGDRNLSELMSMERKYLESLRCYTTNEHCEIVSEYLGVP